MKKGLLPPFNQLSPIRWWIKQGSLSGLSLVVATSLYICIKLNSAQLSGIGDSPCRSHQLKSTTPIGNHCQCERCLRQHPDWNDKKNKNLVSYWLMAATLLTITHMGHTNNTHSYHVAKLIRYIYKIHFPWLHLPSSVWCSAFLDWLMHM